jgi:hypothetical protein
MSLPKIKKANKKAHKEALRRNKRKKVARENEELRVRYGRSRKILKAGQKEYLAKRKQDKDYIDGLMGELENE